MPYSTTFVSGGKGVIHVGAGVVTGRELIAGAVADHTPGGGGDIEFGIVDFTDVTDFQVTTADLRQVVTENAITVAKAPRALVAIVAPHSVVSAMARIWSCMTEAGWEGRVFATRLEAHAWLRERLPGSATDALLNGNVTTG